MELQSIKQRFDIIGDERYKTQRSFDVMEEAAKNEGNVGGMMGAGLGFGMGMNMMNNAAAFAASIFFVSVLLFIV